MQSRSSSDANGIDVSHYQGNINWAKVSQAGVSFAYIKATEGTGYTDPRFSANFKESAAAGIVRGAYHFARPSDSNGSQQADFFVQALRNQANIGELPPALDLEDAGGKSQTTLTDWVNQFAARIKAKTGVNPVVYVSPSFAGSFLAASVSHLPLWVADWSASSPNNFNGWNHWAFWQYTDKGNVAGISGNVDLDVYEGTVNSLHQRFGSPSSKGPSPSSRGTKITNLPKLIEGDSGVYVKDLQLLLYKSGEHPNGITGLFNANTKVSVEAFQKQAGLSTDGVVDSTTWAPLVHHPVARRKTLQLWSAGQEVTDLQYLLQYSGENPGPIDGLFGQTTQSAVKNFQSKMNLSVTGVVHAATWKHLVDQLPQPIQ